MTTIMIKINMENDRDHSFFGQFIWLRKFLQALDIRK